MRGVAILGATGSIGRSALAVLEQHAERFRLVAVTARRNADALEEIRRGSGTKFDPDVVIRLERPTVWREWERVALRGQREERRIAAGEQKGDTCEPAEAPAGGRARNSAKEESPSGSPCRSSPSARR